MTEFESELLAEVRKISSLLELLAEEKIAERDSKFREALRKIVGMRPAMQKSVFLMDGTRTQKDIRTETGARQSHLSEMVGKMSKARLLLGDTKTPHLCIPLPKNFFESTNGND